jgi:hypothetical protein
LEPQFRSTFGLGLDDLMAMPFDRLTQHLAALPRQGEPGEVDEQFELAFAAVPQYQHRR